MTLMAGWISCRQHITLLWSFSTNSSAWSAVHSFYSIHVYSCCVWANMSPINNWLQSQEDLHLGFAPTNLAWYQKEIWQQANHKTWSECLHLLPLLWTAPWSVRYKSWPGAHFWHPHRESSARALLTSPATKHHRFWGDWDGMATKSYHPVEEMMLPDSGFTNPAAVLPRKFILGLVPWSTILCEKGNFPESFNRWALKKRQGGK